MPIPYARPVIDEEGYGVECPACKHVSRASSQETEDDVTKGAMSAHGLHWEECERR